MWPAFSAVSYRVMLALQLRRLALGFTYQESGRNAETPLRSLATYIDWAF